VREFRKVILNCCVTHKRIYHLEFDYQSAYVSVITMHESNRRHTQSLTNRRSLLEVTVMT